MYRKISSELRLFAEMREILFSKSSPRWILMLEKTIGKQSNSINQMLSRSLRVAVQQLVVENMIAKRINFLF